MAPREPGVSGAPIVVAGEALIDMIVGDGMTVTAHQGGGPFNAARTIARLGQPAVFLGRLSRDAFGSGLREALAADGVAVSDDLITDLPTTLAVVTLDDAGVARYAFYSAGTSAPALDAGQVAAALPAAPHSLHVGGLGLVFEPSATTLLDLMQKLRASALISLDPNSRPHAIADIGEHRRVIWTAVGCADIVKFSDEDARILAPGADPEATARELLTRGPTLVILTRGAAGALALVRDGQREVSAPPVAVVDTVGAGDALSGALLADVRRRGLSRDELGSIEAVRDSVEFAVSVAAEVCTRAGADPPYLNELDPPA